VTKKTQLPGKKPYQSPRLSVYGDIRILTQTVNMVGGQLDGGTNMMGGLLKTA
jgi:hypothetical protein